jgi:phospholipase A1
MDARYLSHKKGDDMRQNIRLPAYALICAATLNTAFAQSADTESLVRQALDKCSADYAGDSEKRLACYDRIGHAPAVQEHSAEKLAADKPATALDSSDETLSHLERLWAKPETDGFKSYKQSFVMLTHTNFPNNAPNSPNPHNRVPYAYDLVRGEAKFQFSLKALVLPENLLGSANKLWFGYTQQSYWQIFDAGNSRPFRESNYEPELIFSHRLSESDNCGTDQQKSGLRSRLVNFGVVHQSNGQSDPRSRSWNRAYLQWGLESSACADSKYAVLIRPWWRFGEPAETDNNADLTSYVGHGDVEFLYWGKHKTLFSLLARSRSLQADFSMPTGLLNFYNPGAGDKKDALQLHFQVFSGYGESLIDYNQSHTTVGFGLSVPYDLR